MRLNDRRQQEMHSTFSAEFATGAEVVNGEINEDFDISGCGAFGRCFVVMRTDA
jgi:hypothetical protein